GEEGSVVGVEVDTQGEHLSVPIQGEVPSHMEVTRKAGRDEVLVAVLDPLHGTADEQARRRSDHVTRVDGNLVAETAADVRRDDPDVLLGQAGDEGEHGAYGVGRLACHVDGGLASRAVDVGNAAAGLERRGMTARVEGVQPDDLVRSGEGRLRGGL